MAKKKEGGHELDAADDERREAFQRIRRAAKKFDVEMTADRWQDLGKRGKN